MGQESSLLNVVREITDEEVAFYEEHGWVKLNGLISQDAAAALLSASKKVRDDILAAPPTGGPTEKDSGKNWKQHTDDWVAGWTDHPSGAQTFTARYVRREPFMSLAFSKGMGRAASRLFNRSRLTDEVVPILYQEDVVACKTAAGHGSGNDTLYHQDGGGFAPFDRIGSFNFWIALDEVTPEQGAMRFLDGSHREGSLGGFGDVVEDTIKRYPKLVDHYEWSPPLHYQPGDATVHHQLLIHGAPENSTDRPRWSYICGYRASDCNANFREEDRLRMPEPHRNNPIVYP